MLHEIMIKGTKIKIYPYNGKSPFITELDKDISSEDFLLEIRNKYNYQSEFHEVISEENQKSNNKFEDELNQKREELSLQYNSISNFINKIVILEREYIVNAEKSLFDSYRWHHNVKEEGLIYKKYNRQEPSWSQPSNNFGWHEIEELKREILSFKIGKDWAKNYIFHIEKVLKGLKLYEQTKCRECNICKNEIEYIIHKNERWFCKKCEYQK